MKVFLVLARYSLKIENTVPKLKNNTALLNKEKKSLYHC
jgi:hypothetical protein